jgi:hypothetical protein
MYQNKISTGVLFLTTILCLSLTLVASSQDWQLQNPFPTANNLYSVKFINASIGWAVGGADAAWCAGTARPFRP